MTEFRDWRKEMIVALRSGRELTQSDRTRLAGYLEQLTQSEPLPRGRGRPQLLIRNSVANESLVWFIDELVEFYRQRGDRYPKRAAFAEVEILEHEERRNVTITQATLRRYYREGTRQLRETEARLASRVNEKAEELRRRGVADPIAAALEALATEFGAAPNVLSHRYRRGCKALRHLREKAEKK
ncbi:hypothetical protein [Rhizobium leguminosarum]|uniref:hypothetical protein n=1 Tax=Rhizobium leguminosarum TaxID=384 RepID=UPI00048EE552|nr:hypothetical protein [Rhizobium leguminosarum]